MLPIYTIFWLPESDVKYVNELLFNKIKQKGQKIEERKFSAVPLMSN